MDRRHRVVTIAALVSCGTAPSDGGGTSTTTTASSSDAGSSSAPASTSGGETTLAPASSSETGHGPPPVYLDLSVPEVDLGTMLPSECPCAENTEFIHVVTTDGQLYRFDPPALEFTLVADLSALPGCATPTVFSMSVDRDGMAWLQFSDGTLHLVDINEPDGCTASGFVTPPALATTNFGMGFVSESELHPCNSLFGIRFGGFGLGSGLLFEIDTGALAVANQYPVSYLQAELTGTGDGRLFAFADASPTVLAELDKDSGATLETTDLGGFTVTSTFAFAAYGGDFYFFTVSDTNFARSEVNMIDYDDSDDNGIQDLVEVLDQVPFDGTISGAGVSTCAPTMPPPVG